MRTGDAGWALQSLATWLVTRGCAAPHPARRLVLCSSPEAVPESQPLRWVGAREQLCLGVPRATLASYRPRRVVAALLGCRSASSVGGSPALRDRALCLGGLRHPPPLVSGWSSAVGSWVERCRTCEKPAHGGRGRGGSVSCGSRARSKPPAIDLLQCRC